MFKLNLKRIFGNERADTKTYHADLTTMQKNLHELVEAGEVVEATILEGKLHGFSKFPVTYKGHTRDTMGVDWTENSKGEFSLIRDTLHIGLFGIGRLKELAERQPKYAERKIKFGVGQEGGHRFRPDEPVEIKNGKTKGRAPYSLDEIMNSQLRKGIDPDSEKAINDQESQANLYAAAKYHERETLEELVNAIATHVWYNSVYVCHDEIDGETDRVKREELMRHHSYRFAADCAGYSWLKPKVLDEIVEKVVDIDKNYQSKLAEAKQ